MMLTNLRRMGAVTAVDVGAAGGLQGHWLPFMQDLDFVLIEPDVEAASKLDDFARQHGLSAERCKVVPAAVGLRNEVRCLYVSNARTGSSLFPFKKIDTQNWTFEAGYMAEDYVMPVSAQIVSTTRFGEVLAQVQAQPHLIKLDTQGSELEILHGLDDAQWDSVCAVEVEIGTPGGYVGACTLGDVASKLEIQRFHLMDLRLARGKPIFPGAADPFPTLAARSAPVRHRIWEMDAVFIRDPAWVLGLNDPAQVARLITTFVVYRLFNEALALTGHAETLGLFTAADSHAVRTDLRTAYDAMVQLAQRGYDNCWDAFV